MSAATIELIDSHCHLTYDYAPKSVDDLIREAREAGVTTLMTIGVDQASFDAVEGLSERYPGVVYHTVGIHPHEAATIREGDLTILEKAARHPRCRAVGEIGLDYHYDHSPRDVQRQQLQNQLEIALRVRQPVVIHSREAEDDLLRALEDYAAKVPEGAIPGIIHCFSGTRDFGKACLKLGFYISFSGILTFKNADDIRAAAREFPLERLLVETDSPYLAPLPYRGRKCEPSMVRSTAMKLAEVKDLSLEEVSRVTSENARRVFRL